jgi:AraC-like DNA-binding protein
MCPEPIIASAGLSPLERPPGIIAMPREDAASASVEFDAHAAALRASGRDILLTARPGSGWRLDRLPLERLLLEFRTSGGASIVAGETPADTIVIGIPVSAKSGELVNGRSVGPFDIVVFPPGERFILASPHPHGWITAIVPVSQFPRKYELEPNVVDILARESQPVILKSPTLAQKIIAGANTIQRLAGDRAVHPPSLLLHDCETSLIDTLSVAVWAVLDRLTHRAPGSRARKTRARDLAYRAFWQLDTSTAEGHRVAGLCQALNATERQLRRSFKSHFAIGPNKFARLQRINRVRRLLVDSRENRLKIGSILAACDVTEPGRFATEYRAVFGETPSQTRSRYRSSNVRGV